MEQIPSTLDQAYFWLMILMGGGMITIIVGIYKQMNNVFEKMLDRMDKVEDVANALKKDIEHSSEKISSHSERIQRIERMETGRFDEDFVNNLVMKIRAITPK